MSNYIVQIISTLDSKLYRQIEVNDCYLLTNKDYYEFTKDGETVACFPKDKTIILRVKNHNESTVNL
jgi:hypothetical protein